MNGLPPNIPSTSSISSVSGVSSVFSTPSLTIHKPEAYCWTFGPTGELIANPHIMPLALCLDSVVCILVLIANPCIVPSALCLDLVDISFGPSAQKGGEELQVHLTFILKIYCILHTCYIQIKVPSF